MKVGYLIGALNSGGSERQLSELAVGMAAAGHQIEVFCYAGPGVFDSYVRKGGATVRAIKSQGKLRKIVSARRWIQRFQPDVLHGFMKRASGLAVIANLPHRKCRVVASDFSTATYAPRQPALRTAIQLFRFADRVATQTQVNHDSLTALAPWLKGKVVVVRNGVDTSRFQPAQAPTSEGFQFLCVGTVWGAKNPVNIVKAVRILRDQGRSGFRLKWVGRCGRGPGDPGTEAYLEAKSLIAESNLSEVMSFAGETRSVEDEYRSSNALLHVSIQDGIPNAVVEGMASALPVVVSRVSDLPAIVDFGRNGFVCDPLDPTSIAAAMKCMLDLDSESRLQMGGRSRKTAVKWFGMGRFIREYESLYSELLGQPLAKKG